MKNQENRINLKIRVKDLAGAALIAILLGSSMSLSVLDSLALSFSAWQVTAVNVLTAGVCMAMLMGKIPAMIATVCVAAGIAIPIAKNISILGTLKETLIALLTVLVGGEGSLNEQTTALILIVSVVFGLLAFLLTRLTGGVYPALLLFAFVTMGSWYMEERLILAYTIPGLIALAVLYARAYREGMSYAKAVPAALIAALLAVMLMPSGPVTWKPMADAAEKVRELFIDYFMFTDPRTVYSVSSDGYQPQGEALGGPAAPRDAEIMRVKTDRGLLLRGSVRRTYTGYSWVDNSMNSRYLFIDPTRQTLRDSVFDIDLIEALDGALVETEISVDMLGPGTSTLFVPHRLRSLSTPLELAAYYNNSGEVFVTRSVEEGDSYSFRAYFLDADAAQMNALLAKAESENDPDYQAALSSYMNLPAGLDNDVYWLTQQVIEGAQTPYQKALAIQNHLLSKEYDYRLDVAYPPSGRDFVSYFLLDSKEGYCTYYASAMAVMARLAGLPSRYIEGYLVPEDPTGETLVTGDNAHAWVEIYFEGAGWIPFDATPGDRENEETPDHSAPDTPPTPTPSPEPTPTPSPTPDRGDADQSDDPTATPEPTPTPVLDANEPDSDESTPTPEPKPSEPPEQEPDSQKDNAWMKILLLILGILLLLLLIAALIWRRWRATDPRRLSQKQKDDNTRLMLWYRTILTLLMRSGYVPEGGETPEQFARRLAEAKAAPRQLIDLAQAVECQQYAGTAANASALKLARAVYERLLNQMTPVNRIRWTLYRMARGLGNFHQIP